MGIGEVRLGLRHLCLADFRKSAPNGTPDRRSYGPGCQLGKPSGKRFVIGCLCVAGGASDYGGRGSLYRSPSASWHSMDVIVESTAEKSFLPTLLC